MALVAESLARIEEQGAFAYLESTNPANIRRYEVVGFVPSGSFELAKDGPPVMQVWSDPQ